LGIWVQGIGVLGVGFRVWGLGFRVDLPLHVAADFRHAHLRRKLVAIVPLVGLVRAHE